jgi:hypothetical protein
VLPNQLITLPLLVFSLIPQQINFRHVTNHVPHVQLPVAHLLAKHAQQLQVLLLQLRLMPLLKNGSKNLGITQQPVLLPAQKHMLQTKHKICVRNLLQVHS